MSKETIDICTMHLFTPNLNYIVLLATKPYFPLSQEKKYQKIIKNIIISFLNNGIIVSK